MSGDRIAELEEQIADLKKRWPAHSVPGALMEMLDELEEELRKEKARRDEPDEGIDPDPAR